MGNNNSSLTSWVMFLIGLFSQTQIRVVGSIGISELFIFLVAPFVWITHYGDLRRERVTPTLNLLFLAMLGCAISCLVNRTPLAAALRGLAAPYGFFACLVVFYVILRQSPMSFKWYLLGGAISFVLCTFVFQQAVEATMADMAGPGKSAEKIIEGPIYWIGRLGGFVMWPIQGMYLKCPLPYSIIASFVFGAWSMLTSSSGRSSALLAVVSAILILIGRKSRHSIENIQRYFFPLILCGIIFVFLFKTAYTMAASSGALGESAQAKLEGQTRGKTDMLSVLMGGRLPVFVGGYACLKRPVTGYGPWAIDNDDIYADFMRKYGNAEDYEQMLKTRGDYARFGVTRHYLIPAHSAIIGWWLWYGILGLPIWIYIMYIMYDTVRHRIAAVPAFFGLFATMLPTNIWGLFLSPFGARMPWAFFVAMLLVNRMLDERQKASFPYLAGMRLR